MQDNNNVNIKQKQLTLQKCDVVKVFMMLSVMFYHCICLWSRGGWFVYEPASDSAILAFLCALFGSFHIYVFVFISGYLFYYLKYEKQRYNSFGKDVGRRAQRLLVPYAAAAIIWVIPFNMYYYKTSPLGILKVFGLATSPNQLWFLVMLFVVFVLFYILSDTFEKCNVIIGTLICAAIYSVALVGTQYLPDIFQIWSAGKYVLFYYMGFAFRKYKTNPLYRVPWLCYFVVWISLLSIQYFYISLQGGLTFKLLSIAVQYGTYVFGTLSVVIGLGRFEYKKLQDSKIYQLLSKHNFTMYLLHQQLIWLAISLFNNVLATPFLILVNFAFSILGSLLLSVLISKIPVFKKAFGYK